MQRFVVDDQDHPQMMETCAERQRFSGLMHDDGHMLCTKFVQNDAEEEEGDKEEKVFQFRHHSKKLAISLGLINTAPSTPLQIIKNMWVCEDCDNC